MLLIEFPYRQKLDDACARRRLDPSMHQAAFDQAEHVLQGLGGELEVWCDLRRRENWRVCRSQLRRRVLDIEFAGEASESRTHDPQLIEAVVDVIADVLDQACSARRRDPLANAAGVGDSSTFLG